ncbi:DUF4296 domain-containing protein [Robiginitalea sediminis]|uniref:DUF4296 domain-containing protein n=1 Tax=Robiginitalea sediminis TaxID=1982593 RepID=UPI000B4AFB76|nr:DUF4296 domain-containing protein [Robiginitalea sediminis]
MRYLIAIGTLLIFVSCGEKLMEPPQDLIPNAQMTDILFDLSVMDAIEGNYPNVLEQNDIRVMPFIYEKYGIDSLQFAQSDLYYASNPVEYQQIYEALEARILKYKDSITEVIRGGRSASDQQEENPPQE